MYQPINGFTKASIIERIRERVPTKGCADSNGFCRYRSDRLDPSSACCAVGAFIPDGEYNAGLEDLAVSDVLESVSDYMPLAAPAMTDMQVVHDEASENGGDAVFNLIEWVKYNVEDPS